MTHAGSQSREQSGSPDSAEHKTIFQKQLKLLVEVKRAVPSKVALTPHELAELLLQAHYIPQGCFPYRVGQTCLFCYTDCSRFYYFRFAKEGTRMRLVRFWLMDHQVPPTENQYYSHMQFLHREM